MNTKTINISKVKKCADYIRYLSLVSIERANSGHPGLPLGCAELGVLLYRYIMKFNPEEPWWINRDRFILSAGHGSMLLYSLLYLAGYNINLADLGQFRQLRSKTPGHPEHKIEHGIETTTGPLGQGFANAVGCAIEGKMLAERFNDEKINLFDSTIYTLMGDGCMMEGVSSEAGSLAGHLGLDNLIAIYDANGISIDGQTDLTFSENVAGRFAAMGWHVEHAGISDIEDVYIKLEELKAKKGKPKLLVLKTVIGEGLNDKRDSHEIHGSPAGLKEIAYFIRNSELRDFFAEKLGEEFLEYGKIQELTEKLDKIIKSDEPLFEQKECLDFMRERSEDGKKAFTEWQGKKKKLETTYPEKYNQLEQFLQFKFPASLRDELLNYNAFKSHEEKKTAAIRNISGKVLNLCADKIPQMVGGSADLTDSTKAKVEGTDHLKKGKFSGRKIFFGVREHGMGSVSNGLALNNIFFPFTSTFFTFFDYMKPAVRMAALMKLKHLFIFSHDSIYVGEDGPTHQPIEHLNALRLIPDIYTFRPANDMETAFAFLYFFQEMQGPAAIITTRQKIPQEAFLFPQNRETEREHLYDQFKRGAYIFYETGWDQHPDIIFAASGSEVALALQTAKLVEQERNKKVRVISIPCMELFCKEDISYRQQLLLNDRTPLVMIELASYKGVNLFYDQRTILLDIEQFGESAPQTDVCRHFGFTPQSILEKIGGIL